MFHMGDKYSWEILKAINEGEKSALELSRSLGIPQATVYRKIKSLQNDGLIELVKIVINLSGNEEKFYKTYLEQITVSLKDGKTSLKVKFRDEEDKFVRLWKRLSE